MNITLRRYKTLSDFPRVWDFFAENYQIPNWFLSPISFEYDHTHGSFDYEKAHRFGVWEDDGAIVATACFEMGLGEYIPCVKPGYEFLLPEMLRYAEQELSIVQGSKRLLEVFSTDKQGYDDFYIANGYTIARSSPILVYPFEKGFRDCVLPEGFSLISLEDENDPLKIDRCLWEGFDHGDWTDERRDGDAADCRLHMQSGPHFRKDLTTVVKAPNGDYACFAGMWVDERNGYAYLEPLATPPKYRRKGLAAAALMAAMQKTVPHGAKYCYCGSIDFYRHLGCEQAGLFQVWRKEWPPAAGQSAVPPPN